MVLTLPYSNAGRVKNRIPLPHLTYPHPVIQLWIYNWLFLLIRKELQVVVEAADSAFYNDDVIAAARRPIPTL